MKKALTFFALLLALGATALLGSGFQKRTDVALINYALSEDASSIRLGTAVFSSMGYTRDISVEQREGGLYCSFYSTFGGFNSRLGARNQFRVDLPPECRTIYFERSNGFWDPVLEKDDATGAWANDRGLPD